MWEFILKLITAFFDKSTYDKESSLNKSDLRFYDEKEEDIYEKEDNYYQEEEEDDELSEFDLEVIRRERKYREELYHLPMTSKYLAQEDFEYFKYQKRYFKSFRVLSMQRRRLLAKPNLPYKTRKNIPTYVKEVGERGKVLFANSLQTTKQTKPFRSDDDDNY
jgi:hypothetical protein